MNREVNEAIRMTVEIILTAALILVVSLCAYFANSAEFYMDRDAAIEAKMSAMSDFYHYNNKMVKGVDVTDCIITHPRQYEFRIIIGEDEFNFNQASEIASGEGLRIWSADFIEENIITPEYSNQSFYSRFIMDETNTQIIGVEFEME